MSGILSRLTVGTIGLTCKAFLNIGYCASVKVNGLENLKKALYDEGRGSERECGRGIITSAWLNLNVKLGISRRPVSNHISTCGVSH